MYKQIYFTFEDLGTIDYPFWVEHNPNDILAYDYQNKFYEEIDDNFRTPEQAAFIKAFWEKWNKNQVDETSYYMDLHFIDFLKTRYYDEAWDKCWENINKGEQYGEEID